MKRTMSISRAQRITVPACLLGLFWLSAGCSAGEPSGDGDATSATGDSTDQSSTTATTSSPTTSGDGDGDGDSPATPGTAPAGVQLKGTPDYNAFVRLTHKQWENTVIDIFELQPSDVEGLVATLYPDPPSGRFSNNEKGLYVGPELWGDYQRVAEEIAETVAGTASIVTSLGGFADRTAFIEKVGHRAYRRPLTADETSAFSTLWDLGATYYDSGDADVDGARVFLEALLQSPHFIYRIEWTQPGSTLSAPELVTKLSFLLKNTTPSDELLSSAEEGELDADGALADAALEMISGDTARAVALSFHTELYGLDRYKNIQKSTSTFPNYTEEVKDILLQADQRFFDHLFEADGGLRELLTSPLAYVNQQTARYYDVQATGAQLTEVMLDETRPGFLTRLGFLAYNGTLSQPDPIHRGVDINLRMLCEELEPPPGTIPQLPEPIPNQTNRERVELHTSDAACAKCHAKIINPLGFAFESFDAMGQARTMDAGQPVDTAATYAFNDGEKSFDGAADLINLMAEHEQVHSCYSAMLTQFILGRDVAGRESDLVTAVHQASYQGDASMKELMLTIVNDPAFTVAQAGGTQ